MTSTLRPGHLLSALGALLAAGSLWLPWYGLDLGGAVDDAVARQTPRGPGGELAAQLVRGFASALASLVQLTGWRAFSTTDVVLALGALAVLLAVGALAAGASVEATVVTRLCGALGVAGASWSRPGSSPPRPRRDARAAPWRLIGLTGRSSSPSGRGGPRSPRGRPRPRRRRTAFAGHGPRATRSPRRCA